MDRIEKSVALNAPISRVWDAISDSGKFGTWFGMQLDGEFVPGAAVSGRIVETSVDDEVAAKQRPHVGAPVTLWIEAVDAPRRLAFRWNPLSEPEFADLTTLVEFVLTEQDGGTFLEIVESGLDALPAEHQKGTFDGNSEGWEMQTRLVAAFLARQR